MKCYTVDAIFFFFVTDLVRDKKNSHHEQFIHFQWMEVMARGKSGATVLKLAEENQAQRDALDCATTPNHKMVVKIALA